MRARFNANALSGRGEGGYRVVVPVLALALCACGHKKEEEADVRPVRMLTVSSDADVDELRSLLARLRNWSPSDVLLMPEGTDPATLDGRTDWLSGVCKRTGFRFCPRLHIALYGNTRGT